MCGVFGYIANGDRRVNRKRLRDIAVATETRGHHAFGFAWTDRRGRLRAYKNTGRISDNLSLLGMMSEATAIIGHCRLATHGDYHNNLNNHPFTCDGGWIAHNGVIPQYENIIDDWGLHAVTECDSEVLSLLIERMDGDLLERCGSAVREIRTGAAVVGLWRDPDRLIVSKRGNPVHVAVLEEGIYIASLASGLPAYAESMMDGEAKMFTRTSQGSIDVETTFIEAEQIENKLSIVTE